MEELVCVFSKLCEYCLCVLKTCFQDTVPSSTLVSQAVTQRPAIIRSSTVQYDMGDRDSYPELQRSTVTVELEPDSWARLVPK